MVCRLANELAISGNVFNTLAGVTIRFQATSEIASRFQEGIVNGCPERGLISSIKLCIDKKTRDFTGFSIVESGGEPDTFPMSIPTDSAVCNTCREEVLNPNNRYYQYAFNACVDCGPRYSVMRRMPFDRQHTSMKDFDLCQACQKDFKNPHHRRFQSELQSCSDCGVQLSLLDSLGRYLAEDTEALFEKTKEMLATGSVLAIKGIGGFHLCCDATNPAAIQKLRTRKHRPSKPLAIMFSDVEQLQQYCLPDAAALDALTSRQAPIVLIDKACFKKALPESLAPSVSSIGVMLAYSPLHLMLTRCIENPLVMTSGNVSGAPLIYQNEVALQELSEMVDGFVLHNRDIIRPIDDSLVQVVDDTAMLIRRARGYVPEALPVPLKTTKEFAILSLGADLKNSFALCRTSSDECSVVMSAFNGELSYVDCFQRWQQQIESFCQLYQFKPDAICVDAHPDYYSHRFGYKLAEQYEIPLIEAQHHHAHMAACMAENEIAETEQVLALCLDGLGFGGINKTANSAQHQVWGGELLFGNYLSCARLGGLKPYPLLGGDKANQEPYRNTIALLSQANCLHQATEAPLKSRWIELLDISPDRIKQLQKLSEQTHISPLCSSAGRLFDAVAALLAIVPKQLDFEGQGALYLENLALQSKSDNNGYTMSIYRTSNSLLLDTSLMWRELLLDLKVENPMPLADIALKFHRGFALGLTELVEISINEKLPKQKVQSIFLSGGCMHNSLLKRELKTGLSQLGLKVFMHQKVPANDGGIALGQSAIAFAKLKA